MIVFFSGGTGMRLVARELAKREIYSGHIITTFDSGGSSRQLRLAFGMPAVGDLRNRLAALASPACDSIAGFLNCRLSAMSARPGMAFEKLAEAAPQMPAQAVVEIRSDLACFMDAVPQAFDARGASIGNLALTGAYLRLGRRLAPAIGRYAKLLCVYGDVAPVADAERELGALLENGQTVVGQHLFKSLPSPVQNLYLARADGIAAGAALDPDAARAISEACLICFPMGSFYSSILANVLPCGVGRAIAGSSAPKVFIPNTGCDPELFDLDLPGQAAEILSYLRRDAPEASQETLLNAVLVDPVNGRYPGGYGDAVRASLENLGLKVCEAHVACGTDAHDPAAVVDALEMLSVA